MNKSICMRKGKKGFTVMELVIVIAIIAILAAVLIPTFVGLIQRAHESTAFMDANNLVTTLIPELLDEENDTDLLIFSAKGGKIYVYGFRHDIRRVLPYWNNGADELKLAGGDNFGDKITEILGKLATDGGRDNNACITERTEITNDTNDWRHPNNLTNMLTKNGFNSNTMAIRANYSIDNNFFREEDAPNGGGHNHNYQYEEVDDVNHRTTCTECDFSDLEPHDFDADGKCTKCHYQKQKTLTLTGTYDEANDEYVFTIPEGTAANTIITLDFSGDAMDKLNAVITNNEFQPGERGKFGVKIVDNSGHNFVISGTKFENEKLKQYIEPDGSYDLPASYAPVITKSTDFADYMENTLKYGPVDETTVTKYISDYRSGSLSTTFTDYLKNKYKVTQLSEIPFMKLYNNQDMSPWFPDFPWCTSGFYGLVQGNAVALGLCHVEPEVIKLMTDCLYDDAILYTFAPSLGDTTKYKTLAQDWNFYKSYAKDTWKEDCAADGWDVHSLIELMNGQRIPDGLNFTRTTSDGVTTTSGAILFWWHGWTPGNAFQSMTILGLTSMQITMTAE